MKMFAGLKTMLDDFERSFTEFQETFVKDLAEVQETITRDIKNLQQEMNGPIDPIKLCNRCNKTMQFRDLTERDAKGVTTRSTIYDCIPCGNRLERTYTFVNVPSGG